MLQQHPKDYLAKDHKGELEGIEVLYELKELVTIHLLIYLNR
jgi:hypothetical protein